MNASGTLVHAHLRPADAGCWDLTWTNAGHPHPLLRHPNGDVDVLGGHGIMLFPGMAPSQRATYQVTLTPGTCVLFYTDGLIEKPDRDRGRDIDTGTEQAIAVLGRHGLRPLPELLELLTAGVGGADGDDDIALLVVRVP